MLVPMFDAHRLNVVRDFEKQEVKISEQQHYSGYREVYGSLS
jgi:hypothetical protein